MKLFNIVGLKIKLTKANNKIKTLTEDLKELEKDFEFLATENATLKQINKRKYLQYENRFKFLEKRENKLQIIEQMVRNNEDFRNIRKYIKERQDYEK